MAITYKYAEIQTAVTNIDGIAGEYAETATKFISSIEAATANWSGACKNNFMKLIYGDIQKHLSVTVPEIVRGAASLLDSNATAMSNADSELAKSLPTSL